MHYIDIPNLMNIAALLYLSGCPNMSNIHQVRLLICRYNTSRFMLLKDLKIDINGSLQWFSKNLCKVW